MRTGFELKIWNENEHSYFCLLLWDNRKKHFSARLPNARLIQEHYVFWQKCYYQYYRHRLLRSFQSMPNNDSLGVDISFDLSMELRVAEERLVDTFLTWLEASDFKYIRKQILNELVRVTDVNSQFAKKKKFLPKVDVFLACESNELARLPWECWVLSLAPNFIPYGGIRLVRTLLNEQVYENRVVEALPRSGKVRILIFASEIASVSSMLQTEIAHSLGSIADVCVIEALLQDTSILKERLIDEIRDSRGWDIIFFEPFQPYKDFAADSSAFIRVDDIMDALGHARRNGLQLVIFSSYNNFNINNLLGAFGLQVIAIREPISNDAARMFLLFFLNQLSRNKDFHEVLLSVSKKMRDSESLAFPSIHLLPSFFSLSGSISYRNRISSFDWNRRIQRWFHTR